MVVPFDAQPTDRSPENIYPCLSDEAERPVIDYYYTAPYRISADTFETVRYPSPDIGKMYVDFIRDVSASMGGDICLEAYMVNLLGINRPLERVGIKGIIRYEPEAPLVINARQAFIEKWESLVISNSLLSLLPDRRQAGLESMDEIEAGIVKAIIDVLSGNFDEQLAVDEVYDIMIDPDKLSYVLDSWFALHPQDSDEKPELILPTRNTRVFQKLHDNIGRFQTWLGIEREDENCQLETSKTPEQIQLEKEFWGD